STLSSILIWLSVNAQSNYAVSSIPKTLLPRAGAIVRSSETIIEVKDLNEVYYRKKYAITILNSSARDEANLYLNYDKNNAIKSVKGTIYNEFGLPIAKILEKHLQDRSAVSDFSLYEDNRVKYYVPSQISYPFTIEYEFEMKRKQSLYFPTWYPVGSIGVAVENSSLSFICPESFNLRHKELNYSGKVEDTVIDGNKNYKWQLTHIPALRDEPYSPNYEDFLISVKLAPVEFAYRNMQGSFSNWKEYGLWVNENLLKGRDEVSEATKNHIRELVKDISDPKEKAKKIYEYMQNKTRYISVQIGIGGFQPYPAMDVDRLSYGDCKGLVNYMQTLLKIADIPSYYSVVEAGRFKKDISPDFSNIGDGNHVILCLPFKNDTTWLECTNKFAPFGFLGDFTDDRYVIACTPEGGKIMRTPKYSAFDNKQIRTAEFKITPDGSISGTMTTLFSGTQYDNHDMLLNEPLTEQKKKLPELYPLPNLEIQSLQFTQEKNTNPVTREVISLNSLNYCRTDDGKLHIRLNGINKMRPLKEVRNRVNTVSINRGYYDEDSITYEIPAGYKLTIPSNAKTIEKPFGKYTATASIKDNTVIYKRTMLLNEGNYKAEEYQHLVDFFQAIADADNMELVLNKI
ncbi:MAG: DUF3857 domain-containing protein, partial [Sphingobacteriaceae bacterium]